MTTKIIKAKRPEDRSQGISSAVLLGELDEKRVPIRVGSDIVAARQAARSLAAEIGFSTTEQTIISAAVSEIARNIMEHANLGEMVLERVQHGNKQGISIVARDQGPGIADMAPATRDGYSTNGGLGLGLPGAKRLMDEFNITSEVGKGATVTMRKWRP